MLRAVELCMRSRTSCYAAICYALLSRALELEDADEYTVREYNFDTGGYDLL